MTAVAVASMAFTVMFGPLAAPVSAFQFKMWEEHSYVNGVMVTNCPGGTPLGVISAGSQGQCVNIPYPHGDDDSRSSGGLYVVASCEQGRGVAMLFGEPSCQSGGQRTTAASGTCTKLGVSAFTFTITCAAGDNQPTAFGTAMRIYTGSGCSGSAQTVTLPSSGCLSMGQQMYQQVVCTMGKAIVSMFYQSCAGLGTVSRYTANTCISGSGSGGSPSLFFVCPGGAAAVTPTRSVSPSPRVLRDCTDWVGTDVDPCPVGTHLYGQTRLASTACTSVSACQQMCCYTHHVVRVQRDVCNTAGMFGVLTIDGLPNTRMYTLERNDDHAIPTGTYMATFRRTVNQDLVAVVPWLDTRHLRPTRTNILMHNGNWQFASHGCLLLGKARILSGHHCAPSSPNSLFESQKALGELASLLSFSMLLNPGTAGQVLVTNPNDPRLPVHNHSSARQYYASDLALLDFPTAPLTVIISGAPTCPSSAPLCPHECDPGIGDKKKKCIRRVTVRAASADYATLAPIVDKALVESQMAAALSLAPDAVSVFDVEEGSVILQTLVEVDESTNSTSNSTQGWDSGGGGGSTARLPLSNLTSLTLTSQAGFPAHAVTAVQTCVQCAVGSLCNSTTLQCVLVDPDERSPPVTASAGNRAGMVAGVTVAVVLAVGVTAGVVALFTTKAGTRCRQRARGAARWSRSTGTRKAVSPSQAPITLAPADPGKKDATCQPTAA